MNDVDLLACGIYSVPEASHLTGVSPSRIRRWLSGYEFNLRGRRQQSERVFRGDISPIDDAIALSFLDLQEVRCIAEFRRRHVAWRTLREAHLEGQRDLRTRHPFATDRFKTFGRTLMYEAASRHGDGHLMDIARRQATFRSILAPYLRGLEFLNDQPIRWFPLSGSRRVVLDPEREFGRPIVCKRGVPTQILSRAYRAEASFEKVARWYEVDLLSVKDAVRFELDLAA